MSDRLNAGQEIGRGEYIVSEDGQCSVDLQEDGNLVLYAVRDGEWIARWSSGTWGTDGSRCVMQGDGNLVVYDSNGNALWDSKTYGNDGAYCVIQNDENFVLYGPAGNAIWQTGTHIPRLTLRSAFFGPGGDLELTDSCFCVVEQPPGHRVTITFEVGAYNEFAVDAYDEIALRGQQTDARFERGNYERSQDAWTSDVYNVTTYVVVTGWYKQGPPDWEKPWIAARASEPAFEVLWQDGIRTLTQRFEFEDDPGAGFGAARITAVVVGPM
jgi:hypothetical protein